MRGEKRNLKKTILPVVITMGLLGGAVSPLHSSAATATQKIDQELNDLKKQKSSIQQNSVETQNQLKAIQADKNQANKDLNAIIKQIDETNQKLEALLKEEKETSEELKQKGVQLDEAEARVASRDKVLKSRLRLMYQSGTVSYADVLLSSTSFSDFLSRLDALTSIVNQDKEILQMNKKDRDLIVVKKQEVEADLEKVKKLNADQQAIKQQLVVKEKEKEVKVASLSKKEKDLEDHHEEEEKRLVQLVQAEAALLKKRREAEEAEAIKNGKGPTPAFNGGKLAFPLPRAYPQTSGFGSRIDPVTGRPDVFHKGYDYGAPAGTPILAAEAGVVIMAGWFSSYGNIVIVDHGGGLSTWYAHMSTGSIVVEKGETVKRGQKLGGVGSTGNSTGNHLHFEVRKNDVAVEPGPYLR